MEPESSNRLSTSVASLPRNVLKEGLVVSIEPDLPKLESSDEKVNKTHVAPTTLRTFCGIKNYVCAQLRLKFSHVITL